MAWTREGKEQEVTPDLETFSDSRQSDDDEADDRNDDDANYVTSVCLELPHE